MDDIFYRKIIIKSEDQARKLPAGAVAIWQHKEGTIPDVLVKDYGDSWNSYSGDSASVIHDYDVVGASVIISITLEEIFKEYDQEQAELPDIFWED